MVRTALIVGAVSAAIILSLIGVIVFENVPRTTGTPPAPPSGSLGSVFFIRDPEFTTQALPNPSWGIEAWNRNPDSVCEITNGVLHLFYNGIQPNLYGNSGVFQGRHLGGQSTEQSLLVGRTFQNASSSEYVVFPKNLSADKFWIKTRFKIDRMGYNSFPSQVNLGITLMCAINNESFIMGDNALWLDVYFAGYVPYRVNDVTGIGTVHKDLHYNSTQADGFHAGYYVGEVKPSSFGTWVEVSADLGYYINKTLSLITQVNTETIRVYGFIVFVECVGAYAEVEYSNVETYLT